ARLDATFASFLCRQDDAGDFTAGSRAIILARPENVLLSLKPHDSAVNAWTGRVVSSSFLGDYVDCKIACGDTTVRARISPFVPVEDGAEVYLHVPPERCSIIRDTA